ncbi:hypothetical protein HK405_003427 [Cladochytrium tenue]|nr:hypothetical protein HK405_003427 [Cladochytrium tenue]
MGDFMDKVNRVIETEHKSGLTNAEMMLQNHDLVPVEPARRTWGAINFVFFWTAEGFNITTWTMTSSMLILGLSWWQAWLAVWIGYGLAGYMTALGGRAGAVHHIGFPVLARSAFGVFGSLWPILNRSAMSCIWYGVQTYIGGTCVTQMLRSIWPSYNDIPNGLPDSAGISSRDFLSFFLFWLISLPAIWFPVHQIRHLFTFKMFLAPIGGIAFFVWSIVKAGGLGPILSQPATVTGDNWTWTFLYCIGYSLGNFGTMILNDADFTRFAKKTSDAFWPQVITIPATFGVVSFIGIVVSSSCTVIYGETIWSPIELLGKFLDNDPSPAERFGVFFIAFCFIIVQIGINISANSISAGSDLTALLPRYISIRRGGYICAIVGLCMMPWTLLSSSNSFTTFLSAYSIFLSSISGVLFADYFAVRRGKLRVRMLYSLDHADDYWYTWGINWRAYVAYIAGIAFNIVGFVGQLGVSVSETALRMYDFAYLLGFFIAFLVYVSLCATFPVPGAVAEGWHEFDEYVFPEDDPRKGDAERAAAADAEEEDAGDADTKSGFKTASV